MLSLLKASRRVCQSSVNIFHISKVGTTSTTVIDRKSWKFSASSIVEAAPKSAQPYLRLMRADKPIGNNLSSLCLHNSSFRNVVVVLAVHLVY